MPVSVQAIPEGTQREEPATSCPTSHWRIQQIGESVCGLPIQVHLSAMQVAKQGVCSTERCVPLRILILAGQHGDEPLAREATKNFLRSLQNLSFPGKSDYRLPGSSVVPLQVEFAVVMDCNPDGAREKRRHNASGIDLNRDHQQLEAPETQAIHRFARAWRPDLIVDVHTFPARRKAMIERGIVYGQDVQLDIANNLAVPKTTRILNQSLLEELLADFQTTDLLADRYTLFRKDGRIRHSTPDIVDARNGLALRLGIPTLLIEGRQPSRRDKSDRKARTIAAIEFALQGAVRWVTNHHSALFANQAPELALAERISIRSRLVGPPGSEYPERAFESADTGETLRYQFSSDFTPRVKSSLRVPLPLGYAVPVGCTRLLEILQRHGLHPVSNLDDYESIEESWCEATSKGDKTEWSHRAIDSLDQRKFLFFRSLPEGRPLASHLEPDSKYGLARVLKCKEFPRLLKFY